MPRLFSRPRLVTLEDRLAPAALVGPSVAGAGDEAGPQAAYVAPNFKVNSIKFNPLTDQYTVSFSSSTVYYWYSAKLRLDLEWTDRSTHAASGKIVTAGVPFEITGTINAGTFERHWNKADLPSPLSDADLKYAVARITTVDILETTVADNEKSMLIPEAVTGISVTTTKDRDSDASPVVFGDYLSGVSLSTVFTVKTDRLDTYTKKFELFVEGYAHPGNAPEVRTRGANGASFTLDPGRLTPGDHLLHVRALDAGGGPLAEYTGTIRVVSNSALNVKMKPTVGAGEYDIDQLRVLKGVPASFKATAVLGELDNWSFYNKRTGLQFVDKATGAKSAVHGFTGLSGNTMTLTSPLTAALWQNPVADSAADDYDVFLVPLAAFNLKNPDKKLSPADGLKVVPVPAWLADQPTEFKADAGTAAAFGTAEPGYRFTVNIEKGLSAAVPVAVGSEFGLLNGLKSSVALETNMVVYAKLTEGAGDAEFSAEKIKVKAVLFGKTVYDKKLDPAVVAVDGTINPTTLDAPTTITVRTANPVSLLGGATPKLAFSFGEKYGKTPWKVEAPIFGTGFLGLTGYASISGQLTAELSELDFSGALNFHFDDGDLVPDRLTSTFQFDVAATATASLTGALGVNATVVFFGGFNLFQAEGTGTVTMDLTGTLAAKYGAGGLEIDTAKTTGDIDLSYDFTYDASDITKEKSDADPDKTNPKESKDVSLWDLVI